MKTFKLNISTSIIGFLTIFCCFSFIQQEPWKIPTEAKSKLNPVAESSANINLGKGLYMKHCRSCHGKEGLGDGPKSEELMTYPGDFSTSEFQSQSDGTLFYKTMTGRDDMPSFKNKVDRDDDIWAIIRFMRTLKQ